MLIIRAESLFINKGTEMWTVTYRGFLQTVSRSFDTKERAIQWARQCGVFEIATISQ